MRVVVKDLGAAHADTGVWITPHSDIHNGHPDHNPVIHQHELDWLGEADNHYGILAGDMCEMALKDSVGDVYDQPISPQKQAELVVTQYTPYKDKILAACGGNHEARVYRSTGFDPSMIYSSALGVPYQAEGVLLVVKFGKRVRRNSAKTNGETEQSSTYYLYFTHGWGAARTIGAKLKNISELRNVVSNADVYIGGHNHQPGWYPMDSYEIAPSKTLTATTVRRTQHFISLGSALDYAGYAQVKGMSPTSMLFPRIHLAPYVDQRNQGERNGKHITVVGGS